MRYISYFAAFMSLLILYTPGKSQATSFPFTTYETASFSIAPGGNGSFNFDAFEPNLGSFTWQIVSARISVTQNITLLVNTPPNFFFGAPSPYSFRYRISQDFFSVGGFFPDGFTTLTPRSKDFTGTASGAGGITSLTKSFNYSFLFDSNSDLSGGFEFSGNGIFEAFREDFLSTGSDLILGSMDLDATKIFGLSSSFFSFAGSGNLRIRYDGELQLEDGETPPAFLTATPVPAVLPAPLLAAGFASICLFGWRRKRAT